MEDGNAQSPAISFGLGDVWAMLRVHRLPMLGTLGAVLAIVLVFTFLSTKQYLAVSTLQLTIPSGQELGVESLANPEPYRQGRDVYYQTQLEIIASESLRAQTLARYAESGLGEDPEITSTEDFLERLSVRLRRDTELVDISVEHPDPKRAAVLANLLAEVYREHNLNAMRDAAREARAWLEEQLAAYDSRLDELSTSLVTYQEKEGLADAEQEVSSVGARVEALKARLASTRAESVVLASRIDSHARMAKAGAYDELAKHMDTPLVRALTEQYAQAVATRVQVASRYGELHPERVAAEQIFLRIREELVREVDATIESERTTLQVLQADEARLEEDIAKGNQNLLQTQTVRSGYERLRGESERSKAYLARLAERKDELDLLAQTQLNNVRVIQKAREPISPFRPSLAFNLAFGLVFGVVAAIGVALVREYLDDRVITPADVTSYLGLPYLGHVPELPPDYGTTTTALYTHEKPHTPTAEMVRAVRTFLEMGAGGRRLRRLLVTSAVASEGKTDTTARLAIAFAHGGRRVIVIDADLRSPRMHRAFGFKDREPGLVDVLAGANLADMVRTTSVPGVHLLAAGSGGLNVKELLGSPRMEEILAEAETSWDLVLLDTPPTILTADPAMLSRFVEGVVMVVRWQKAPRALVRQAVTTLKHVGAPLLGVVLNATSSRTFRTEGYYKDRYGYGYGYGNSDDNDDEPDGDTRSAAK